LSSTDENHALSGNFHYVEARSGFEPLKRSWPPRRRSDAGHTLKAATGCTRSGLPLEPAKTEPELGRGNSDGLRGQGYKLYPAQDASFWGLAHEAVLTHTAPRSVESQRAAMRRELEEALSSSSGLFLP
jgi:hypothetical protein